MANVLPKEALESVWAMYRSRLVLVTGLALLCLAAAAALTLVPSYVALHVAAPPVQDTAVSTGQQEDVVALERSQLLIKELKGSLVVATSSMSVAEDVLVMRPKGIVVTRLMYQKGENGQITLSGSGKRDTINGYKDALIKSGKFTSVSVPVGALVSSEGGNFTIVVTGDF